ncbi:hypothetical protein [Spartinivicinus ruber]|uniref:hypothetical protein n=1 Tax=Spartinivicinus ruber TaxID=2683272 RepID=UPI0013D45A9D|nr:hypothetical protein [Spartinivicinus ruber]
MKQQEIYQSNSIYKAFPDWDQVFNKNERGVLLPIGLVSFSAFDNNYDDQVLIALPIEPEEGLIGDNTGEYGNETCSDIWLSYSYVDGKWQLDCDIRLFMKEHPDWCDDENMLNYYQETISYFKKVKNFYQKNGFIQYCDIENPNIEYKEDLITLGGLTPSGQNWDAYAGYPYTFNETFGEDELTLFNSQGDKYQYIGTVSEYYYKDGGDTAHFFYEPKSKNVRLVVDYS